MGKVEREIGDGCKKKKKRQRTSPHLKKGKNIFFNLPTSSARHASTSDLRIILVKFERGPVGGKKVAGKEVGRGVSGTGTDFEVGRGVVTEFGERFFVVGPLDVEGSVLPSPGRFMSRN